MKVFRSAQKLRDHLELLHSEDPELQIGFVPTMGALHAGHLSLVDASVRANSLTVCSIFVNPIQFGDQQDLLSYPKPIAEDISKLIAHRCDILFLPEPAEIYPPEFEIKEYPLDGLDKKIEGASRPGHFQGVCNVLDRFFDIIVPDRAYFGQKDFQQTVVVKKLVSLQQRNVEICVEPITREPHGLAMSSRNERLSPGGRMKARFIHDALEDIRANYLQVGLAAALVNARAMLEASPGATLDYLVAVDADSLEPVGAETEKIAVLTVVEYEGVRLLDNMVLSGR